MSTSESGAQESWVSSFCSLLGHEYFAEVSEDFIEDDFNLTGLAAQVPMYKEALEMILDVEPEEDEDEEDEDEEEEEEEDEEDAAMRDENGNRLDGYGTRRTEKRHARMASDLSVIESSAELLYGLIHQRYITSRAGIQQMAEKFDAQHFGHCPRVYCNQASVLPVGVHDSPGIDTVKLFCGSCLDVYTPPNSRFQSVDGAFFGTTFGCLFFMTFPDLQVLAKGDPLKLAPLNPIFAQGSGGVTASAANDSTQDQPHRPSRSSSLTSNAQASTPASVPALPPEWIPPPGQPTVLNGMPTANTAPGLGPGKVHEPRIYGFRVSERAKTGPRMQWLRSRPVDMTELDEARRHYAEHGGNGEDDDNAAAGAADRRRGGGAAVASVAVERRKKAVARTRRRNAARPEVMDTNGMDDATGRGAG